MFDLDFTYESDRPHKLRAIGTLTPYHPARVNCSNDDACPEEGGELEDLQFFMVRVGKDGKERQRQIPAKVAAKRGLEERVYEELAG